MENSIMDAMTISAFGMRAQGDRIRVATENVANSQSLGNTPGADPYRRKLITFKNTMDRELGFDVIKTNKISVDRKADFGLKYMPAHPAADASGYVKTPNVNGTFEMADVREAQRSYEANLSMLEMSRNLVNRLVELLRI